MTKVRRPTLNPQILLLIFLGLGVFGQIFAEGLEGRRQNLARGRNAYLTALTSTKTQLSGLTRRLMADQAIKQNLAWNLSHSVSAAMSAKLQKGGLDEAWIIDESCAELGRAAVDHPAPLLCPLKDQMRSGFFWRMVGDHPALAVVAPFPGGAAPARFAVGMVVLDDDWLALYPGFSALAREFGLHYAPPTPEGGADAASQVAASNTIGTGSDEAYLSAAPAPKAALGGAGTGGAGQNYDGVLLAAEGLAPGGLLMAPLTSHGLFDRFLVGRLAARHPVRNPIFWPLIVVGLAIALLTLARDVRRQRLAAANEAGIATRCRELLSAPSASCLEADAAPPPLGPTSSALPHAAEALLLNAWRERSKQLDLTRARIEELAHEVSARDAEVSRLSLRLAESAELDSLAMQMARTTAGFLAKAAGLADEAEGLSDVLGGAIAEQSKLLFNVLMEWQEGVAARGARKFIRSLAETEGASPGSSLLDEQIMALAMMAGEISDLAANASVKSHGLVDGAAALARIAALWQGLASLHAAGDGENPAASLANPLEQAMSLVRLDKRHGALRFSSRLEEADLPKIPAAREGAWVTALYHVLVALAESATGKDARVGVRLRAEKDRMLLIAQLSAEGGLSQPQRPGRMAYHLEIARAVLAPFGVSVSALPVLDGPFPIALSWPRSQAQIAGAAVRPALAEAQQA